MQKFYGIKSINAKPMNRAEYNKFRGWELPADENGADEGYLVEYLDGGKANTTQYIGYVSWSPKDVFDKAYKSVKTLPFSSALEALKAGARIARAGWNGKDMWLCAGKGHEKLEAEKFWNPHTKTFAENNGGFAEVLPYIIMKTADGKVLMGWLASQTDMLAEDWQVLEEVQANKLAAAA